MFLLPLLSYGAAMSRLEIILLCLCLGACTTVQEGPVLDPITAAGLAGQGYTLVETHEQFVAWAVGHTLFGSGYRVRVQHGGTLRGQYHGEWFDGVWDFRDGHYCQSLGATFTGPTAGCYWVAAKTDDIQLIPIPYQEN